MQALNNINSYMKQFFPPILTIVEIFGNSISLFILTRKDFIKVPMFRYLILIFCCESISLVLMWLQFVPLLLKREPPVVYCQIFIYLVYIGYKFYPWIHVLNSFDRLLFIKFSTKFKKLRSKTFQFLILTAIFAVCCFACVPYILYETPSNQTVCTSTDRAFGFFMSLQNLVFADLIPFGLMLFSTSLNIQYLMKNNFTSKNVGKKYSREKGFLKSVLSMDVWLFMCYTPYSLLNFSKYADIFNEKHELWPFFHNLSIIIVISETSCNFFVLLICNTLFRRYYKTRIIRCGKSIKPTIIHRALEHLPRISKLNQHMEPLHLITCDNSSY